MGRGPGRGWRYRVRASLPRNQSNVRRMHTAVRLNGVVLDKSPSFQKTHFSTSESSLMILSHIFSASSTLCVTMMIVFPVSLLTWLYPHEIIFALFIQSFSYSTDTYRKPVSCFQRLRCPKSPVLGNPGLSKVRAEEGGNTRWISPPLAKSHLSFSLCYAFSL